MLRTLACCGAIFGALLATSELRAADDEIIPPTRIENVLVRDGVNIAIASTCRRTRAAIRRCLPPHPIGSTTISPRRPHVPLARDRADHLVRRSRLCLRAHGRARLRTVRRRIPFLDSKEQHDFYDVIEWIAQQPWSNGKVGGIGQSYYAMAQWFMAIAEAAASRRIAPFDGLVDNYRRRLQRRHSEFLRFPSSVQRELRPINQYPVERPLAHDDLGLSHGGAGASDLRRILEGARRR